MHSQDTMIITEASLPRPDGGAPFALVSDDGHHVLGTDEPVALGGGSDMEAMSFARPVLVDRGATFTERLVRDHRAATSEPTA
jgi:hypothetical protein